MPTCSTLKRSMRQWNALKHPQNTGSRSLTRRQKKSSTGPNQRERVDKVESTFHLKRVATGWTPLTHKSSFSVFEARPSLLRGPLRRAFRYHGQTTAKRQRPSVCRHSCKTHRLNVVAQHPTAGRPKANTAKRRLPKVTRGVAPTRWSQKWLGESKGSSDPLVNRHNLPGRCGNAILGAQASTVYSGGAWTQYGFLSPVLQSCSNQSLRRGLVCPSRCPANQFCSEAVPQHDK